MGDEHLRPLVPEEHLRDLGVELVVLGQEEMQAPDAVFRRGRADRLLRRRRDLEGEDDNEAGALPLPAGVGDGSAIGAAALLRRDSLHDGGDFPPGRLYLMQLP